MRRNGTLNIRLDPTRKLLFSLDYVEITRNLCTFKFLEFQLSITSWSLKHSFRFQ